MAFDTNNYTIQNREAAKIEAKANAKLAGKQGKLAEKEYKDNKARANREEKRRIIAEKKANNEGIYKKVGPFRIRTYIIIAIIIAIGIIVLLNPQPAEVPIP